MQWLTSHCFYDVSTLTGENHHAFNFSREKQTIFFSKIEVIFRGYKIIIGARGPVDLWWVEISLTLMKQRSLLKTRFHSGWHKCSTLQGHSNHPAKWKELRKLFKREKT